MPDETECDISSKAGSKAWARLLAKIYEIDPFVCPKCCSEMRVIAVIQDLAEIKRILKHLKKGWSQASLAARPGSLVGRAPPDSDYFNLVN